MEDFVSVIVPAYNRRETIIRSVQSIIAQSYSNLEIIVVDDASTDDTVNCVRSIDDPRIRIIRHEKNKGANAARNTGIKAARGDVIAFNDSDDEWFPDKLEKQLVFMAENGYSVVFSPYIRVNNGVSQMIPSKTMIKEIILQGISSVLKKGNVLGTPTLVAKKNVIDEVGFFDESLPRFQDYDYAIRLSKLYLLGFLNEPTVNAYIMPDSITLDRKRLIVGLKKLFLKHTDYLANGWLVDNLLYEEINANAGHINVDTIVNCAIGCYDKSELYHYISETLATIVNRISDKTNILSDTKMKYIDRNGLLIYGAGEEGKKAYLKLKSLGYYPKAFLVSTSSSEKSKIDNIGIIGIDEYDYKGELIAIAANKKNCEQIVEKLESMKRYNYLIM